MATMPIKEVDRVEVLTILDNTVDLLLAGNDKVKRLPVPPDAFERESLVAEHGFDKPAITQWRRLPALPTEQRPYQLRIQPAEPPAAQQAGHQEPDHQPLPEGRCLTR